MSLIICSECGHENQEDARYCDMCGIELPLPTSAEVTLETEEIDPIAQEEEYAPIGSPEEEEELQPVGEIPQHEEEEELQPVGEIPQHEEEEELQPVGEIPQPMAPVSSATVLDWDEPEELIPEPSTALEVIEALLVHPQTDTSFDLPSGESLIYLGKINEEMPVQIDLSNLPNADIISRVHAVIHVEKEAFYLEDAGSLNGTALNGEALKPGARFRKPLKSGDTITLGRNKKIHLTFEIKE